MVIFRLDDAGALQFRRPPHRWRPLPEPPDFGTGPTADAWLVPDPAVLMQPRWWSLLDHDWAPAGLVLDARVWDRTDPFDRVLLAVLRRTLIAVDAAVAESAAQLQGSRTRSSSPRATPVANADHRASDTPVGVGSAVPAASSDTQRSAAGQ